MPITLSQLEAEVQARCGPFEEHTAASGTTTTAVVDALKSTIGLGGYTDRWLTRRAAAAGDRSRRVASYDPATGTLTVDRPYAVAPAAGEALELGVLDPEREVRPAVLRGLTRTFFVERAAVEVTEGQVAENLSAALYWITDPVQIRTVESRVGLGHARNLRWYRILSSSAKDGSGGLRVDAETSPPCSGVYVVEALRPQATWVNGADAHAWPSQDGDVLVGPLGYAAALGHAEAWRRCRATLAPIAAAGYAPGLEAVAQEVNHVVREQWWYWDRPDRVYLPDPRDAGGGTEPTPTWRTVDRDYSWRGLSAKTWEQVLETA